MVNKKLIDQMRDEVVKRIVEDTEEIALAACAAGVPISEMRLENLSQHFTNYEQGIVGNTIYIGCLAVPITVKLY